MVTWVLVLEVQAFVMVIWSLLLLPCFVSSVRWSSFAQALGIHCLPSCSFFLSGGVALVMT